MEENSVKIMTKITGTSPLIMNKFTNEAAMNATSGTRASSAARGRETPEDECRKLLHTDEGGKVILPTPNLMACFVESGTYFKIGRAKISTQKKSLIPACVFFDEVYEHLKHDGWHVDTRPVRVPATGGRILRNRPMFNTWSLKLTFELDQEVINKDLMYEVVRVAGKRVGLGDFRPACKGPYGRFRIDEWKITK